MTELEKIIMIELDKAIEFSKKNKGDVLCSCTPGICSGESGMYNCKLNIAKRIIDALKKEQYAVIMRRNGERETHSYLLGIWPSIEEAIAEADSEKKGRPLYEAEFCLIDISGKVIKRWMNNLIVCPTCKGSGFNEDPLHKIL